MELTIAEPFQGGFHDTLDTSVTMTEQPYALSLARWQETISPEWAPFGAERTHQCSSLNDLRIDVVSVRGLVLRRREPLVLHPAFRDEDAGYYVDVPDLGKSVPARSLTELSDAICDFIAVFWLEYALEDDKNLTAGAQQLKVRLLENYMEVRNAAVP